MGSKASRLWLTAGALALATLALLFGASAPAAVDETTFNPVAPIEGVSLTPLGPGAHAFAMAVGPDGNLWFAGSKSNFSMIGRMTPDGEVTEFALPEREFGSQVGIVAGPDENLWFTESTARRFDSRRYVLGEGRVGRITTGGDTVEFPVPGGRQPGVIAVGPDGNLWFTEERGVRIGRITPGGSLTEFPLRPGHQPASIATGPDGNLWFTEKDADRIGRITPSGAITEFPLSGPSGRPDQIVLGPDGNLWFTFEAANKVGRITPLGEVDQFPVPTSTGTEAIMAGPDGNIWFTSQDRLGSISPGGRPVRLSCPNRECHLPLLSLAGASDGLWFGTWRSVLGYGGGLTEMTRDAREPGYVGRLMPQPPGTMIGSRARPVVGRRTDLRVSCFDTGGCHGAMKLLRRAPGYFRRNSHGIYVLASRSYQLAGGESRRISLRLTPGAARLLTDQGSLPVWATSGIRPDVEAIQSIVLRPRAEHRPLR
jgi:streptogramin lyase